MSLHNINNHLRAQTGVQFFDDFANLCSTVLTDFDSMALTIIRYDIDSLAHMTQSCMVVGPRWAYLLSETADLLGFLGFFTTST